MATLTSKKPRPLLIPHKRTLLPLSSSARASKILNPSAVPAETRIKKSYEEATEKRKRDRSGDLGAHNEITNENEEDYECPRFEVPFSMPPQPFLDPVTWEAMLKHSREKIAARSLTDVSGSGTAHEEESAERIRQREEREMEYGSMAIRGRSSMRGRGKRGQGRANVYWGGRH